MLTWLLMVSGVLGLGLSALGQSEPEFVSVSEVGLLRFNGVSNAVSYRVEGVPVETNSWTNVTVGGSISGWGSGVVTASISIIQAPSVFYRVVADVVTPPPAGMALIPAGSFVMGNATNVLPASEGRLDELPQHTVNVSGFYMDVYKVTKALWDEVKAFNGGNGYTYANTGLGKATNHPVHTVNWYDVVKWCNARSQRDGLTPVYYTDAGFTTVYKTGEIAPFANWAANGYRLPTEAEWEKAARGGLSDQRFPWGATINHTNANYRANGNAISYDTSPYTNFTYHPDYDDGTFPYTSPVDSFAANGYGLYDMAGDVWEWCWDWYDASYYASSPTNDPRGPVGPLSARVMRGGSWGLNASYARVAIRFTYNPDNENFSVGFRCARGL